MKQDFHYGNRQRLYRTLPEDTLVLLFSGHAKKKTADEDYPFYADRVQTAGNLAEFWALSLLKSQNFRQIPHWMDIRCFLSGADGQEDAPSELLRFS